MKILKHEKSVKPIISIQVDHFFGKVNIAGAAVIDSGYKLLLEKHNNPVKKTEILCKIINCLNFFGKFKLCLKEHYPSTSSKKVALA